MGAAGLLAFVAILQSTADVQVNELSAKPLAVDLRVELRDNGLPGEWARQEDYELVTTREHWSVAIDHHALAGNVDDAQIIVSFSIDL